MTRDPGLRAVAADWPNLCLEAHSTDYQRPEVYVRLAELGFAFQKVGPALTFAYREAIYALDLLRGIAGWGAPIVQPAMEAMMLADPRYWQSHYHGSPDDQRLARHVGYADRIRYYWPRPEAQAAVAALFADLDGRRLPEPLLLQVFPRPLLDRAEALEGPRAQALVTAAIQEALDPYFLAEAA
jgi:D-tagatose-1,6-bisphosphate aldolase subunit GatZ/KbaZ